MTQEKMTQEEMLFDAEVKFNEILKKGENHNELVLLGKAGWEELFPEPGYWTFRHNDFPGIIVRWFHGTHYGRAFKTFC